MKRNLLIFLVALAAFFGSIVAAAVTDRDRSFNLRGYVDPLNATALPERVPRFGVNAELTQYDAAALERHLDLMERAHVVWVRQFARWNEIEPQSGAYDWRAWDAIASAFRSHPDLRLLPVLVNSPSWARTDGPSRTLTGPPGAPEDFARFAAAFAARYADIVDVYQIWDEPNLTAAWGDAEPRPASYLALLEAATDAIRGADTHATILAAALAPTVEQGPHNISDWRYLADLLALGAADLVDGFAGKPYGFDSSAENRYVSEDVMNASRLVGLREVLDAADAGHLPIWASAWGWNSLPENWTGSPSVWGAMPAQARIDSTLALLERADTEWPWLGGMILTHWQPAAALDDPLWGFALVTPDGTPTPLLEALIARTPPQAATNGWHPAANPYARYSGVWTFGPLGADIGWIQDSQLEFTFAGAGVGLRLREDNYVAYLYPTVDGQPANALPRDADGNAYIVLTSGSLRPELTHVTVAEGLPSAQHTLRVVTDRGYDRWALAGYAVSAGNLATPYRQQFTVALITAAVSALAALVSAIFVDWPRLFRPLSGLGRRLGETSQLLVSAITSLALLIGVFLTWGDAVPNLFRREPVQMLLAVGSAGLLYIEPGLLLTILAALVLFVLFFHRHDLGLMLVVFWAPFFLFPVELYNFFFPMSELLLLMLAPAWALRMLVNWGRARQSGVSQFPRRSRLSLAARLSALDWGVVLWVALSLVSLVWTERPAPAITELRTLVIEPVIFYAILRTARLDRRALLRLVDALLTAGMLVAVIGLFLYLRGEAVITAEEGARRLASVYGSPNNVALFLGRCIPFALAFALLPLNRARRTASGLALAVMVLAVLLTQSAGALVLGIPFAVIAVLLIILRRQALLPVAGLLAAGVAALALSLQSARFARLLDLTEGTNFYRLRVWQSALSVIRDRPLTGLGLDQFLYAFRDRYISPDAWQEPDLSHPHNFLLDFWVRLGIGGPLVFLWLQVAFWRAATRVLRRTSGDVWLRAITIGMVGSMVNLLAHGLVDNSVFVNDLSLIFALLIGTAGTLSDLTTPNMRHNA